MNCGEAETIERRRGWLECWIADFIGRNKIFSLFPLFTDIFNLQNLYKISIIVLHSIACPDYTHPTRQWAIWTSVIDSAKYDHTDRIWYLGSPIDKKDVVSKPDRWPFVPSPE